MRIDPSSAAAAPGAVGGPVLFGASTTFTSTDFSRLDQIEGMTGRKLGLVNWFQSFPTALMVDRANKLIATGRIPMVTWQPAASGGGVDQPDYQLTDITAGKYDTYIRSFAADLAKVQGTIWLRYAPEMNGDWEPWSEGVNGNPAGSYVPSWRHVHDIVNSVAKNVKWVWTPNVPYVGTVPMQGLYPGDAYVDYTGYDGYNFGTTKATGWRTYSQIFSNALTQLEAMSSKPVVLAEVGCVEQGGSKAAWVQDFLKTVGTDPKVVAFSWFDMIKGPDFRIDSSASSAAAFKTGFTAMSRAPQSVTTTR